MIRKLLAALTVGLGAVGLALVPAPQSGAEPSVLAVGWWSRNPGASAPEDGIAVGGGGGQPSTVAAVRIDLGRGLTSARLVLLHAGGLDHDGAVLRACGGSDDWAAAAGGSLDDAPEWNCGTSNIHAERSDSKSTIDVTALVEGSTGTFTVVLLPGDESLPFEAQFHRPALEAQEKPGATTTTFGPVFTPPPSPSSAAPAASGGVPSALPAAPSYRRPAAVAASPATIAPAPSEEAPDAGSSSDDVVEFEAAAGFDPGGDDSGTPWSRGGLFVLLAAAAGTAAALGRRRFVTDRS